MNLTVAVARKVLGLVDSGLVSGLGQPKPGQMCIEAAVCFALGLPHGDDPPCVGRAVRAFKIRLNDSRWSSNEARAKGMRRREFAQEMVAEPCTGGQLEHGAMSGGPIEPAYRAQMNAIGEALDDVLNGDKRPREHGFVLLMFRFGEPIEGRMNYLSNAEREDMLCALKELIANFEGRMMPDYEER